MSEKGSGKRCEHNKNRCKDCGLGYCPSPCGKRTDQCIEHNLNIRCDCIEPKIRSRCVICTPSAGCPNHPKTLKTSCRQCNKRSCDHKKSKDECIICSKHAFCEHDKLKRKCTKCRNAKLAEENNTVQ